MKLNSRLSLAVFVCIGLPLFAQNAPLSSPSTPPAPTQNPEDLAVTKKGSEDVNAMLVAARNATKEKRYADSRALMLKVTGSNPSLVLPWVELGLAQMGLQKYSDAENSFNTALGINPASANGSQNRGFYRQADAPGTVAPEATRASRNTLGGVVNSGEKRTPDTLGTSYAALGEIYFHENKIPEAKNAFDMAVKANPSQTALYRHNEAVFCFKAGDAPDQLEAANKAISADPARAANYYFKAQALVGQATIDPKTQKLTLPPGCAEAYEKYLSLRPDGQFAADSKSVLASTGIGRKSVGK